MKDCSHIRETTLMAIDEAIIHEEKEMSNFEKQKENMLLSKTIDFNTLNSFKYSIRLHVERRDEYIFARKTIEETEGCIL